MVVVVSGLLNNNMISIIICTYNRADLLPKAIDSVLSQDYRDFELIIIDDASTDNTEQFVRGLTDGRIKYYKNDSNLGISKSRNKGVSLASGEYIAMLDSDDYWLSTSKLSQQLTVLETDNEIGLVGTGIVCVYPDDTKIKEDIFNSSDQEIRNKILLKNQFAQSSVLFRKEAFTGYDESLVVCEDLDLWLKIGQKFKLANISEPLTAYLINPKGISKESKKRIALVTDLLINRYQNNYPNYFKAKLKSWLRIIISL